MEYINSTSYSIHNTAVALGKFEGLHLGHQILFREILEQKRCGLKSVIFTFDMPPLAFLHNEHGAKQIYTRKERYGILKDFGVDCLIEYPFTMDFASLSPEEFIRDILVKKTGAKVIVVGEDFRFGKKRSGSVEDLSKHAEQYGYRLIIKEKLKKDGKDISSSRIRDCLGVHDVEEANTMLGRAYFLENQVIHGNAIGRSIHIPTANFALDETKLTPPDGVYVSRVKIDERILYGITNIGVKPTIKGEQIRGAETHIFDFDEDIYDRVIKVELLSFVRREKKFQDLDALVEQMGQDIKYAKEYVAKLSCEVYNKQ